MPNKAVATLAAAAIAFALAGPALAHHGWSWTEDGFFELTGTITAIAYGNPHPTLDVDAEGETWRVDLATPRATANAGFMEDSAKVGDTGGGAREPLARPERTPHEGGPHHHRQRGLRCLSEPCPQQ